VLNIYGPYLNRVPYWVSLLSKDFVVDHDVVLGGDFNLSLGNAEIWGPKATPDSLANFFIQTFAQKDFLDIEPIKVSPTWRNRRSCEDRIAKRLDRFLVADSLVQRVELVRQWVGCGGISDHSPIFFELKGRARKPPSPFKFNPRWLKDASFCELVRSLWIPIPQDSQEFVGVLFMENLHRVKQATIIWAKDKRIQDEQELRECEERMD